MSGYRLNSFLFKLVSQNGRQYATAASVVGVNSRPHSNLKSEKQRKKESLDLSSCSSTVKSTIDQLAHHQSPSFNQVIQLNSWQQQLVELLESHHFESDQIQTLLSRLSEQSQDDQTVQFKSLSSGERLKMLDRNISFWKKELKFYASEKRIVYTNDSDEIKQSIVIDHNYVLSQVEPDLLFIDPKAMLTRIDKLKRVGFISGYHDLWRVFAHAPRGFYLQSWSDFLLKYNYIQYRIMDWLQDRKKNKYEQKHPLVLHPRIMERSYDEIKCRFLFALRCGYRKGNLGHVQEASVVRILLDTPLDVYLEKVAPGLTEEEYRVFEVMIDYLEREEDEIFRNLSELGSVQGDKWTDFEHSEIQDPQAD